MNKLRRRIAAVLAVAIAFAMPLPVVAAPAPSATVVATQMAPAAVTTADLKCVTMVSDTVGYAAGASGTIIKTVDGGNTWVKFTDSDLAATDDFRGIAFWNASSGIAVTSSRKVVGTEDGGATWTLRNADMTQWAEGTPAIRLNGVTAVPGTVGKGSAFGGDPNLVDENWYGAQIWHTEPLTPPTGQGWWVYSNEYKPYWWTPDYGDPKWVGEGEITSVDFVDSTRGWAVGSDSSTGTATGVLGTTINAGLTWTYTGFSAASSLTGVAFGSVTNGVIVSSVGRVFFTANGGTAWTEGTGVGTTALNGVEMTTASNGWTVGAGGKILRTVNGGANWTQSTSPTASNLAAVSFSGTQGVAVGSSGAIAFTTDGATWSLAGSVPVPDTTKPIMTSLTSSTHPEQTSWYPNTSATFTWDASDIVGVTGYSYVLDETSNTRPAETSLGSAKTATVALTEGVHWFHVIARDAAGNWSTTPQHYKVQVDLTAPSTTDNHLASYSNGVAEITLTATDDLSHVQKTQWAVTGTAASSGTSTSVVVSGAGSYTLTYASTDYAGNKEATSVPVTFTIEGTPPATEFVPVEGLTRYTTAIAASQKAFPVGPIPSVVIATGKNWPDALGGAALAGVVGGPILLTDPNALPDAVADEIVRLGATKAYILGGTGAVSAAVQAQVDAIDGVTVERIEGANRYATANNIATKVKALNPADGTMFVATGLNFPDALAASPLSAAKGWPLYLTAPTGLTQATIDAMKAGGTRVVILGSTGAVPLLVQDQLNAAFGAAQVDRQAGPDRYLTAVAIAKYGVAHADLTWQKPAIATGTNFPDALAGGVLQGHDGSVLLLTKGTELSPATRAALTENKAIVTEVRYLGSLSAVSAAVRASVESIFAP